MTPDRWQQISQIYHAALTRSAGDRAGFLREACAGDDVLEQEVASLLANESYTAGFLSEPAFAAAPEIVTHGGGTLLTDRRIGVYQIQTLLGAGGMGEVYRARDTKLNREVALKVLPDAFTRDPDRLARFKREARALASLNHPHIGAIYGFEDSGETHALVLELVEGETLADRIARGPVPLEEALPIARQIGEALQAAHEQGIIHRDLKPSNIKITPDGVAKVLDFGLAKLAHPGAAAVPADATASPTITSPAMVTGLGVLLGTAAYMSPEQAKGREADRRSDIWAFGCVLYEMVSGRRPFHGEDITETIAAVVKDHPDFAQVPAAVRRLLKSCLEKDPKKRLQAIGDMRLLLEDAAPTIPVPSRPHLGTAAWALASAAILGAALLAFIHFRETPPEAPVIRSTILPPGNTTLDFPQGVGLPALSPDGQRIVFGARTADGKRPLWVRALDGLTAQPLADTEGATFPFWSPDSRFIAFFADGKLKKTDASGGPVLTLADARLGRGGSWSRDGVIVFAPGVGDPLQRVSSVGGASSPVADSGSFPWFLPDARHFVYQALGGSAIRIGSLDGSPSQAVGTGSNALYAQGHLLFLREDTLMAQPFDTKRFATAGEAVPVAERVQTVLDSGRVGVFSVSETGLLAYREGAGNRGGILTWVDRSGKRGATVGEAARQTSLEFSPDRARVAVVVQDQAAEDVWIYDVSRGLRTRFTFDAARDIFPVWSPDGRSIVFSSNRRGRFFDLYRKAVDSVGAEELLYADDTNKRATSWSADGKFLLYDAIAPSSKTGQDIWVLPLPPERTGAAVAPSLVLQTTSNERDARFSPDGRWMLYSSNESQREMEVYVAPFPLTTSGPGGKRQVSTGGTGPYGARWRQDGREIFYVTPDRELMATEVAIKGGTLELGTARSLIGLGYQNETGFLGSLSFNVSADGQRFLLSSAPERQSAEPLTLILNWASGLNK